MSKVKDLEERIVSRPQGVSKRIDGEIRIINADRDNSDYESKSIGDKLEDEIMSIGIRAMKEDGELEDYDDEGDYYTPPPKKRVVESGDIGKVGIIVKTALNNPKLKSMLPSNWDTDLDYIKSIAKVIAKNSSIDEDTAKDYLYLHYYKS